MLVGEQKQPGCPTSGKVGPPGSHTTGWEPWPPVPTVTQVGGQCLWEDCGHPLISTGRRPPQRALVDRLGRRADSPTRTCPGRGATEAPTARPGSRTVAPFCTHLASCRVACPHTDCLSTCWQRPWGVNGLDCLAHTPCHVLRVTQGQSPPTSNEVVLVPGKACLGQGCWVGDGAEARDGAGCVSLSPSGTVRVAGAAGQQPPRALSLPRHECQPLTRVRPSSAPFLEKQSPPRAAAPSTESRRGRAHLRWGGQRAHSLVLETLHCIRDKASPCGLRPPPTPASAHMGRPLAVASAGLLAAARPPAQGCRLASAPLL